MIQKFIYQYYQSNFNDIRKPKLLSVSYVPKKFNKEHPRVLHQHTDAFELLLITSGKGFYYLDTTYYPIRKGDLVFCNSGVLHDELPQKNIDLSYYGLRITDCKFQNLPENHIISNLMCPIINLDDHYESFEAMFNALFKYADHKYHLEEFCENLMMSIISFAISIAYEKNISKTIDNENNKLLSGTIRVYEIKLYIDHHYHDDLSLKQLGDLFNLSPYYLSHLFKKAFEIPPMQYIYRRRIGEAQSMLIATEENITEIAGKVGFNDPNYFTIQFKKYVGITPSKYRQIYSEKISDK